MSKILIIAIALIVVTLGFNWFNANSAIENLAIDPAAFLPAPKLENNSIEAISVSRESAELSQLQKAYSEQTEPAESVKINPDPFIDVDDYSYQRDDSEVINVGEMKDAGEHSHQENYSQSTNAEEVMDLEMSDSTY